jgi:hypothetical protein
MVSDDPESFADLDGHEECFANGACNSLRNPASADHWIVNGISNTVSDLLSLDEVAKGSVDMANAETTEGKIGTGVGLALLIGLNAFTGGEEGAVAKGAEIGAEDASKAVGGIIANAQKGAAFEKTVVDATKATDTKVAEQVTLKTESGVKTRMDVVSQKPAGTVRLQEAKSSAKAPLTKAQKAAHPEIAKSGATVVGQLDKGNLVIQAAHEFHRRRLMSCVRHSERGG